MIFFITYVASVVLVVASSLLYQEGEAFFDLYLTIALLWLLTCLAVVLTAIQRLVRGRVGFDSGGA